LLERREVICIFIAMPSASLVCIQVNLEAELLEMEMMEAKGAGGGIEMMDDELTLVLKSLTPRLG
jgi:hypothetical protein